MNSLASLVLFAVPRFASKRISLDLSGLFRFMACYALICASATVSAQTKSPTATTFTVTSAGNTATTVTSGTVVTLTATVKSGATALTTGQVNFCDATAVYCTGGHLYGTTQLTASGVAVLRFRPSAGTHTYHAVFLGTSTFAASTSGDSSLTVAAKVVSKSTTTTISKTGSWGNYALVGTITEAGSTTPLSGTVSFLDTSYGNAVLESATLGASQPGWTWVNSQTFQTGITPFSVVNTDFNGDGIPDLAVANARSNTVTILRGNGDGTFTSSSNISFGSEPYPLITADFNGDGIQDLGVVNYVQNTVTILLGKGDGTFTELSQTLSIGGIEEAIMIGDFNGDGIPDIITTTYFGPTTIFLGSGNGTFKSSPIGTTVTNWLQYLVSGDFNGDGKLDFAGLDGDTIRIFLGNGDGTFAQSATTYDAAGNDLFASALTTTDFDDDGKPDLMLTTESGAAIVLHGNGDGTFTVGAPLQAILAYQIAIADFNDDGNIDAALLNPGESTVTFLLGNGDGTLSLQSTVSTGNDPTSITVGDFNGDGRADIATANSADNTVLLTEPSQTASTVETLVTPAAPGQHQVEASFAGSGDYNASVSAKTMLWGQPPATTTALSVASAGSAATTVASGSVVSLTATVNVGGTPLTSGEVDFCNAASSNCTGLNQIGRAWLTTNGTAVFRYTPGPGKHSLKAIFQESAAGLSSSSAAASLTVNPPAHVTEPTASTIIETGEIGNYTLIGTVTETGSSASLTGTISFLDTSYSNKALASTKISANTAGLAWQNSFAITQTQTAKEVTVTGDFNGDGISDIAAANFNSAALTVLLGKGDGTFSAAASPTASRTQNQFPYWMATGDFNGDGRLDIAVLSVPSGTNGSGNLSILLGNGDGTFAVNAGPAMSQTPMGLAVADFNGDGKLDLVIGDYSLPAIPLLGNGDGTFTPVSASGISTITPQSIAVGDLNGDGPPDLAIVANNVVTLYLSNGDGTFRAGDSLPVVDSNPFSVTIGDLNRDGTQDLAIGDISGEVSVLLGKGDGTFTPVTATANAGSMEPASMVIGDFNNDGKADLAVAGFYNNAVLLGKGDGTFTVSANAPVTDVAFSIAVGDFDGDGTQDIAVGNRSGIAAFLTQPTQTATFTANGISPSGPAPHLLDTAYGGDTNYAASASSTVSLDVQAATPVISPSTGTYTSVETVTITDATPGVTIYYTTDGTTPTTSSQIYSSPISISQTETLKAFANASGYAPSAVASASYTIQLQAAPSVRITLSSATITTAQALSVTVAVSGGNGTPTGIVALACRSYNAQQTLASGSTTFTLAAGALPSGADTLKATYMPDSSSASHYSGATQSAAINVTAVGKASATVLVTPSAATITNEQAVTVAVSVSGDGQPAPTGSLTFSSGSYSTTQALNGGSASFQIQAGALPAGTNTLSASYFGDATYAAASGSATVIVSPVAVTLPTPPSVSPGSSTTGTVTFTAGSSYSGTLNLTCSLTSSPSGAQSLPTCSLAPASITMTSGATQTATLTIKTTAGSNTAQLQQHKPGMPWLGRGGTMLAAVLVFLFPAKRRKWLSSLCLILIVIAGSAAIGCGGSESQSSTPGAPSTTAGSYTFTVTGTDTSNSAISVSTKIAITVQ